MDWRGPLASAVLGISLVAVGCEGDGMFMCPTDLSLLSEIKAAGLGETLEGRRKRGTLKNPSSRRLCRSRPRKRPSGSRLPECVRSSTAKRFLTKSYAPCLSGAARSRSLAGA